MNKNIKWRRKRWDKHKEGTLTKRRALSSFLYPLWKRRREGRGEKKKKEEQEEKHNTKHFTLEKEAEGKEIKAFGLREILTQENKAPHQNRNKTAELGRSPNRFDRSGDRPSYEKIQILFFMLHVFFSWVISKVQIFYLCTNSDWLYFPEKRIFFVFFDDFGLIR
jgi:hypothetical protein